MLPRSRWDSPTVFQTESWNSWLILSDTNPTQQPKQFLSDPLISLSCIFLRLARVNRPWLLDTNTTHQRLKSAQHFLNASTAHKRLRICLCSITLAEVAFQFMPSVFGWTRELSQLMCVTGYVSINIRSKHNGSGVHPLAFPRFDNQPKSSHFRNLHRGPRTKTKWDYFTVIRFEKNEK